MKKKPSLSLYWKCQLIGWSIASLYWGFAGYAQGGFNFRIGILQFVSDVALYMLLTHLYRNFALRHNWQQLNLNELLKRIIPSVFILGLSYTAVTIAKIYFFRSYLLNGFHVPFSMIYRMLIMEIFIAGIRLMSIWLLAYHLYQYARREIRLTKENAQLVILTKDAQLSNLSAQLNPHFLFNSLNNIKALVIENPVSSRRAIDLLSELLRTSLYGRKDLLATVKEELDLVEDYLELEKLRLEERLQYRIEANQTIKGLMILRLSIQTLVENAIKHGIDQQKEGGLIAVELTQSADHIRITVQNPGQLSAMMLGQGLGLKNLKERLEIQFTGKANFEIVNQSGTTVLATILIPIQ
ncbi:sensor histidine kinase [Pedobacter sp. L105]|uniref:sensor histidine kinase n=1 Tax=Pedobacter sp. L105 TaxID=1641871 RepID=UPI00131C05CB|nr:histidine kinase [Pedobacter sp. L105]